MKRMKLIPSILLLVMCAAMLGVGVYSATPMAGSVGGVINVIAATGITISIYEGQSISDEDLIASTRDTSQIWITPIETPLDARSTTDPEGAEPRYYTMFFSTNDTTNYIVDTQTIEVFDGVGVTSGNTVCGAVVITNAQTIYR